MPKQYEDFERDMDAQREAQAREDSPFLECGHPKDEDECADCGECLTCDHCDECEGCGCTGECMDEETEE